MAGGGSLQHALATSACRRWRRRAAAYTRRRSDPADDKLSIVVADYGSSQGRNSLVPTGAAIEQLRSRLGADALMDEFYGRVREAVAKHPAKARCNWRLVLLRLAKRS
jgi:hypothetical protein